MQGLGSWNQFLKISNYLKTCSTSFPGAQCLILLSEFPSGDVEGQQLQQCRVQSPHRQMTGAFGKRPFVVHSSIGKCIQRQRVDWLLPGAGGGNRDWQKIGTRFLLEGDENALKLWWWQCSSGNTKNHRLSLKWVNCMVCKFYLNKVGKNLQLAGGFTGHSVWVNV